ncbi:Down syndrome cell adhesion molecule-like protein Dscam2 [Pectinophora gossypiella]|uniref:Down syndrome cell adhesion molecule-like protein Dscam2 n=1 Tax=Pectinophora gossypiella TaxID=13191 RepID=UPI00214E3CB6|nr:Down syndrome cell adhesion molecule-like protein Dscam2 [Pectinophora gossypiella]
MDSSDKGWTRGPATGYYCRNAPALRPAPRPAVACRCRVLSISGGEWEKGQAWLETPTVSARTVGAGQHATCRASGHPAPTLGWVGADYAPLPADANRVVSDNGSLLVRAGAGAALTVRCRAHNSRGAVVSAPLTLSPVWSVEPTRVEAETTQASGMAALHCVGQLVGADHADDAVRWWRNDSPLEVSTPTPESEYISAGERGEWLLVSSAVLGQRYACQPPAGPRSPDLQLNFVSADAAASRLSATSGPVRARAGAAVCLPCAAPLLPPPHYTWYRGRGGRVQAAAEAGGWLWRGGAALCWARVAAAAAGGWTCRAATSRGDATARVALTVTAPIRLKLVPQLTVARGGDAVRLECRAEDAAATLAWLHQGAPATLAALGAHAAAAGAALLLRASPATRGFWQCEATSGTDVQLATAELRLAEASPELRYTFIEQALRAGARVSLRCTAGGAPRPRFSWSRDGVALEATGMPHRYSISEEALDESETASTLNVTAAAPEDGGRYTCRAANRLGHADHSARLNIYGPPMVRTLPPQRVLAGENATILCPYAGYPISAVWWWRGAGGAGGAAERVGAAGRVAAAGGALALRPAAPHDAGLYTCVAAAPAGASASADVHVLVLSPPQISPFSFSPELSAGARPRVLCGVVAGERPLSFAWLKDAAPLPRHLHIEETSMEDFSMLKFAELTAQHSGNYTCRVTNRAASVDYTATLNVKVPPVWTHEPMDAGVAAGAELRVQCAASGQPTPTVAWQRRRPCTVPSNHAGCGDWHALGGAASSAVGAAQDLWLPSATPADRGLYRCSADNSVGPPLIKIINLTIYEPALVESSNETVNVSCVSAPSSECALWCVVRGAAPLSVTWTRDGGGVGADRWTVSQSQAASGPLRSELRARRLDSSDAGHYRCLANNAHGRSQRSFVLHVEESPAAPQQLRLWGRGSTWARLRWRGDSGLRYSARPTLLPPHASHADPDELPLDASEYGII